MERLGPCQQPVPCSYFMALNLSWSGPAHEPQVLWESKVLRVCSWGGGREEALAWDTHPRLVGEPPSLGFCETSLKGQSR